MIDELTQAFKGVLSTGGGAVLRASNRSCLKDRTQVVYLKSRPDELFKRLRHDTQRPLLQVADPQARLRELFDVRDPLYRETAHFVIETGRPNVSHLVNMIQMQLELANPVPDTTAPHPAEGDSPKLI
jgi:shikimate kinase